MRERWLNRRGITIYLSKTPIFQRANWGSEKLLDLLKVTHLVRGRTKTNQLCSEFLFQFFFFFLVFPNRQWKPFIKQVKKKRQTRILKYRVFPECHRHSKSSMATFGWPWSFPKFPLDIYYNSGCYFWCFGAFVLINLEMDGVLIFNHSFFSGKIKIRMQQVLK